MDDVGRAILSDLEQKGFPKIAAAWRPFIEHGCTIYLLSDEGYQPRDGYALFWASRYFPPLTTEVDRVEVVPVCGGLKRISTKNLIIIGRLRSYESEELVSEALGETLYYHGHFRFIDNKRMFQVDTGEMWARAEGPRWIRDYGVLRLWQQQDTGRAIMNFSGLGAIGTLGTSLAITDLRQPAVAEVEARLLSPEEMQQSFIEILVRAEWAPRGDPVVIGPSDVTIEVERSFHLAAEPNWPLIRFQRIADDEDWLHEVWVIDTEGDKALLLTQNQVEFAVLAAIAKHTEKESSTFVRKGGYISYEQIAESEAVKEIIDARGLYVPTVRATISRLRKTLKLPEWKRTFPNLLLEGTAHSGRSRREKTFLRLRAKFEFQW